MFGQSISGNVDMDDNGYAGAVGAEMQTLLPCAPRCGDFVALRRWCKHTLVTEAFC